MDHLLQGSLTAERFAAKPAKPYGIAIMAEAELDARGLLCPLPVLKARKRLAALPSGAILNVVATDPMAAIDMPHFCNEQGHTLLSHETDGGLHTFRIRRA